MLIYENECLGCPPELGCMGEACRNRNVPHLYCDECKDETTLYHYDEKHLCIECITEKLKKVEVKDQ